MFAYYRRNKEKLVAQNRARRARTPGARLMERHGITYDDYKEMFRAQGEVCALCRLPGKPRRNNVMPLVVDHCHETKRIRGLLCHGCNLALGKLGDTIPSLARALAYLQGENEWKTSTQSTSSVG